MASKSVNYLLCIRWLDWLEGSFGIQIALEIG
jgi:hypothetical protein